MCRDDDTFFLDFAAVTRMLDRYDSGSDWLIGSLSESTKQVCPDREEFSPCADVLWRRSVNGGILHTEVLEYSRAEVL